MYGGWTEYVVLWTHFLGFIWDIKRFLFRIGSLKIIKINDDKK